VLCTGNSCRSQIAEAYLRHFGDDNVEIYSAGIETHGVNPKAVKTMADDGIDISRHTSNHIDDYQHIKFDYIITVCDNAKEKCPFFPSESKVFHHNFPDPAKATGTDEEISKIFIEVRNLIKTFCQSFVKEHLETAKPV